ncbi:predicted protein [Sclerotinia sclerotiorum 1980 UF-70]|uniref:Uncharacterized protein n=1 Tax=Sclerotinia sclerotiorum (strain ATCC 18683 / 1980 / Ss-1) TaxID=665079 RepID=A7F8H4_SCLS1|nr:predicted protein [Sclerotinia sclerotiorum 1980 UF-70]EDN99045.1 predicted protein [Sclerotinia sclerotiorum 1980 UF-70]
MVAFQGQCRAACLFLQNYLYLSNESGEAQSGWIIPGLIQPHHAIFILLMYLGSCASSDADAKLSRSLVDKFFNTQILARGFAVGHASSGSSKFTHSSSAPPISHGSYGHPRQDVLVLLSEGSKWMELVTGKDVEDFAMDKKLDDIMRGGENVWDKWEKLIETVFKC